MLSSPDATIDVDAGAEVTEKKMSGRALGLFAVAFWSAVGGLLGAFNALDGLSVKIAAPIEFAVRAVLGREPSLTPNLKIFNFDDSTFAALNAPGLNETQWAGVINSLAAAGPRAIVTTHMFGTGDLDRGDGPLARALDAARARGVDVIAGAFAYPSTIKFRPSLNPSALSLAGATSFVPKAKDLSGYRLYGPSPTAMPHFSRLGHQGYEGDGRAALMINLGPNAIVPHISLAVAHHAEVTKTGVTFDGHKTDLDADGKVRINLLPARAFATGTKSLRALLDDADAGRAARYVEAGDVALVLLDMYTSKTTFVATPQGLVPGGYVTAATLNDVLTQHFLREIAAGPMPLTGTTLVFGFLAMAIFSSVQPDGRLNPSRRDGRRDAANFVALMVIVALGLPTLGVASFAFYGICVPWLPALVLAGPLVIHLFGTHLWLQSAEARAETAARDRETARLQAIVRTAQMFAHDVRKPFSLLNMAMQALRREPNPARAGALISGLAPELARAMASVDGMIQDIMEVGDDGAQMRLNLADCDLSLLLTEALRDVLIVHPTLDVSMRQTLKHTLPVRADAVRLKRTLINILDNAVQATGPGGDLWLESDDVMADGRCVARLVIGNSGSYIPPAHVQRVFEAFFTSGKRDGTGLGLAIAQKIVTAHGGKIWCLSTRGVGTEFLLTLPVAEATPKLPAAPVEVASARTFVGIATPPRPSNHEPSRVAGQSLQTLVVVDDNAFVLEAWEAAASDATVLTFISPEACLSALADVPDLASSIDALVTDFNFEQSSYDGRSLARELRRLGVAFPIFLSTDGDVEILPVDGIVGRIPKEPHLMRELLARRVNSA